jgi:hypothetical protein
MQSRERAAPRLVVSLRFPCGLRPAGTAAYAQPLGGWSCPVEFPTNPEPQTRAHAVKSGNRRLRPRRAQRSSGLNPGQARQAVSALTFMNAHPACSVALGCATSVQKVSENREWSRRCPADSAEAIRWPTARTRPRCSVLASAACGLAAPSGYQNGYTVASGKVDIDRDASTR